MTGKRKLDKRTPYRKAVDQLVDTACRLKDKEELVDELMIELNHEKARFAELEARFDQHKRDTAETFDAQQGVNKRLHAKLISREAALTRARCMIAELIDEGQLPR